VRQAANDDAIQGILIRIDSPGGSAVGSDDVWRAIQYARVKRNKPVVVSMGSVAASGGYWIAMGSDGIVAEPATMTGSIGVVFGKLNIRGAFGLVGAHIDTVKAGENAGIMSEVESLDEQQSERVRAWMGGVYGEFKDKVASGRGLERTTVDAIARGRVWSGTRALEHKLVDKLGGYREAIELLKTKARLDPDVEVDLVLYPPPKSFFELLFSDDLKLEAGMLHRDPLVALRESWHELFEPGAFAVAPELSIR
jgi:protease-4